MISLACIFTMEKALVKIFGRKSFICQPVFARFTTGCKRIIRSHFDGVVSEQGDMLKGSFQRMVLGE